MKPSFRALGTVIFNLGFDPRRLYHSFRGFVPVVVSILKVAFQGMRGQRRAPMRLVPIFSDLTQPSGSASGHYFHQDIWAAQRIFLKNPAEHLDIGSRVDGFIAHLLVFRNVTVADVRDLKSNVAGLTFLKVDITQAPLRTPCESISCLHALEHFGLGRYGDQADIDGWRKGLRNIARSLSAGGTLYLSVPIGRPRIELNAQHVFHPNELVAEARASGLSLNSFSFVDDSGALQEGDLPTINANDLDYGCGLFEFSKSSGP